MSSDEQKLYDEIYEGVARDLGLPPEIVRNAYKGFWLFVKNYINDLPLKDPNLTEEDFLKIRTSVNIPSLGKFQYPVERFRAIKAIKELKKLNKDDSQKN